MRALKGGASRHFRIRGLFLGIIIIFVAVTACLQLGSKMAKEPLQREVLLAIRMADITLHQKNNPNILKQLSEIGVRGMVVSTPAEATAVSSIFLALAEIGLENWELWRQESSIVPQQIIFINNKLPTSIEAIDGWAKGAAVGLIEMQHPADFAIYSEALLPRIFRVYYPKPHLNATEYLIAARERQSDVLVITAPSTLSEKEYIQWVSTVV
ncbi:MAG: hypothetical protein Q8N36_03150, partial [bacterium]|nr:hypothetical protein [bacterium]